MLIRVTFLCSVALLIGASSARAQDLVLDTLGTYLEALRSQAGIPGLSAAIVGADRILWDGAFGHQDLERSLPVTADSAFHLDGVTQLAAASLVLGCVEDGRLQLDDPIGRFTEESPDGDVTLREILTHTTSTTGELEFEYRPGRLDELKAAVEFCTDVSLQEALRQWLDRLGMVDSVPGPDAIRRWSDSRYRDVLGRLAVPYRVDDDLRPHVSTYDVKTLTATGGLISTVRDVARFDLALRRGLVLARESRTLAWSAPPGRKGGLPHGLGWFVQRYNGQTVVWQFGFGANASSSLVVTVPTQDLTFILLANSDGLARPYRVSVDDVTASPFARLFLEAVGP